MTADDCEPMSLLVKALGIADQLLDEHVANPTGEYCVRCSGQATLIRFPCPLRHYAEEAKSLE